MDARTIELTSAYQNDLRYFVVEPPPTQRPLSSDFVADLEHSVRQHYGVPLGEGLQFWLKMEGKWLLVHPTALEGGNTYVVSWADTSAHMTRRYRPIVGDKTQKGYAVFDIRGRFIKKDDFHCIDLDIGLEVGPYGELGHSRVDFEVSTEPSSFTILESNPLNEAQMLSISTTRSSSFTAGAGISAIGPHPVPVINLAFNRGQQKALSANISSVWETSYNGSNQNTGKVNWNMQLRKEGYTEPNITAEATYGFLKRFSAVVITPTKPSPEQPSEVKICLEVKQRCNKLVSTNKRITELKTPMEFNDTLVFQFTAKLTESQNEGGCPGKSTTALQLIAPEENQNT